MFVWPALQTTPLKFVTRESPFILVNNELSRGVYYLIFVTRESPFILANNELSRGVYYLIYD